MPDEEDGKKGKNNEEGKDNKQVNESQEELIKQISSLKSQLGDAQKLGFVQDALKNYPMADGFLPKTKDGEIDVSKLADGKGEITEQIKKIHDTVDGRVKMEKDALEKKLKGEGWQGTGEGGEAEGGGKTYESLHDLLIAKSKEVFGISSETEIKKE